MAQQSKAAVWFLGIVGTLAVFGGILVYAFNLHPWYFMRLAYIPGTDIVEEQSTPAANYLDASGWYSFKADLKQIGMTPTGDTSPPAVKGVDVFFIHPTTYLKAARWNAPIEDQETNYRSEWYVMKNQASAFNGIERVFAPRYRQATFGAFLDQSGQGVKALEKAHGDIRAAFEIYMNEFNEGRPFILAGHSQGALHSLILLKDRIAGTPAVDQLVAAYIIGWPVGLKSDLEAIPGIDRCETAADVQCIISWQSFIPPAFNGDPDQLISLFKASPGLNGQKRSDDVMLCTNPLTWVPGTTGGPDLNKGGVGAIQSEDPLLPVEVNFTGASCSEDGILLLDREPQEEPWTNAWLPGKNTHIHDVNLFYVNVRENARLRAKTFLEMR